jgi:hypothetical protein
LRGLIVIEPVAVGDTLVDDGEVTDCVVVGEVVIVVDEDIVLTISGDFEEECVAGGLGRIDGEQFVPLVGS